MKSPGGFNLSDWTLRHRALVGYFMFAIAVMGFYGYAHLGQAEDPPFTFKIMVIRTFWPGATAQEVELQLTDKIEKKLQETPWVDRVSSFSKPGESTVLFFAKDATPKKAVPDVYYQVRKKVGDIRHTLPAGVIGPFFNDEFGDVYGNLYAISGDGLSYAQLKANSEQLRDDLLRVKNVGKVELFGVQDEKIYVEISNAKLATLGLDQNNILQALSQQNAVAGGGYYETSNERIFIRPGGAFNSVEAVRETLIRAGNRAFRLGDIAEVKRSTVEPAAPMVRHQGKPAILVGVAMVQGGDIIQLGKDLRKQVSVFQARMPVGVDIGEAASQPDAVKRSISDFVRVLAEAVIVVLVVNFLSLGLRTGLVVAISIPLVLAASFFCMYWLDIGLHKVSLGALVLALGLLVDDAIIAIEMMWVKMEQGWDRTRAAAFAYTSTAGPMLSGTLVTVAGFLPIAIAQSAVGEYAIAFFQVNAVALMISWLAAVVAIPWLGYKLLPDPHAPQNGFLHRHIPRLLDTMHRLGLGSVPHANAEDIYNTPFYQRFRLAVSFAVKRRWLVIGVTFSLFALSILGMNVVQKQFFPNSTRFELMVELRLAEGASVSAVEREVKKLENWLQQDNSKHKDYENFTAFVGSGAPRYFLALDQILPASNVSQFVIQTRSLAAREALRSRLIALFDKDFQSLRANVTRIENGPPVGYPVQYRVSGTDVPKLRAIAGEIGDVLRKTPELSNINMDWDEQSKTVSIEIDQDKARLLGVSSQDIANFVTMSLTGYAVTTYREADQSIDVVVRDDQTTRTQLSALGDLAIPTRTGKSVPLTQIGHLKYSFEPSLIWRRDRLPTITVRANLYGDVQAATLADRLAPQISAIEAKLPQGFSLATGGAVEETAKGQDPVLAGMPIFVLVVITILMLQLQNFSRVVIVLLTAPLG
ncbi:MAG: Acriflavin resistance protein, partial [Proteobacteria bacterium]|nr:Acriflavin resistance protein [Pseudomonadota bacterium]